ncbi:hypothetical protein [uncultured Dokdonia sp.]|uniref:hypothetical protein n=1 Tax=uncultured Dokdonia sp. TaxID=575653 RepID=UPI00262EAD08|nr:hypothetical protein [uncultured Dokdonia sp.]
MATIFDIKILWSMFKDAGLYFTGQASKKNENIAQAHHSINDAFIETYDYLRNNQGNYIPKPELAKVWNLVATSVSFP